MKKICGGEQELIKIYGKPSTIKVTIGGVNNYIIASCGEIIKTIKIKETKKKAYYPTPKEKNQIKKIIDFCKQQRVRGELIVWFKTRHATIKHTKILYEPYIGLK